MTSFLAICGCAAWITLAVPGADSIRWSESLRQPEAWYGGGEAARIADNVLLYQRDHGGWDKNVDMARPLSELERTAIRREKGQNQATVDNGATYTQLAFLARVAAASGQERFKTAFMKGIDYLLVAQYDNGGWPQYYPLQPGYFSHITFNDDAMIGVMSLLRDVSRSAAPYGFVDEVRRKRATTAVERGIECILRCQVLVDGKRTAWCAQHDEKTLAPASARTYEKISLSGSESAGIVRFLMGIENPSPQIIEAIESAVAWFRQAQIRGIRVVRKPVEGSPKGYDTVVVPDSSAPPTWARFYEIGTNRPIFCGRDGMMKGSLAEIEYERRNGYAWYTTNPARLLAEDYAKWKAAHRAEAVPQNRFTAPSKCDIVGGNRCAVDDLQSLFSHSPRSEGERDGFTIAPGVYAY